MNDDDIAEALRQGLDIEGLFEDPNVKGVVRMHGVVWANAWGILLAREVGVEEAIALSEAFQAEGHQGPAARMIEEKLRLSINEVGILAFVHLTTPAREIIDLLDKGRTPVRAS